MKNLKNGRAFNITVAVFLALVLWLYVINVENPTGDTTFRNFPIQVQGADTLKNAGLMVTNLDRDTLKIKVTGRRKTLMQIPRSKLSATLDLSGITGPGTWTLTCHVSLGGTVSEGSVSVSESKDFLVTATVEKTASKVVPVQSQFRGTLAAGYEADPIQMEPSTLEITGPEDYIQQISSALVDVPGEDLSQSVSGDMPFLLLDQEGNTLSTEHLILSAEEIAITLPVVKVYEIPLSVEFVAGGGAAEEDVTCTISPQTVRLSGDDEVLSSMKELVIGQVDLSQVFTLRNFTFPIQLPQGITLRSEETQASVQVSLQDLPMRSIATSQITLSNIPRGWNASLVNSSIQVWVRGEEEVLNRITGENIRVEVDLSQVQPTAGQRRAEAKVSLVDAEGLGVVGTDYSVAVSLSR